MSFKPGQFRSAKRINFLERYEKFIVLNRSIPMMTISSPRSSSSTCRAFSCFEIVPPINAPETPPNIISPNENQSNCGTVPRGISRPIWLPGRVPHPCNPRGGWIGPLRQYPVQSQMPLSDAGSSVALRFEQSTQRHPSRLNQVLLETHQDAGFHLGSPVVPACHQSITGGGT